MHLVFLIIAYSLSRTVNAIPNMLDNPVEELTGTGFFEDPGELLANTDIFNSQSDFNPSLSSSGNTDLFSESSVYDPTLSLANSGFPPDDPINYDLFPEDYPDAAGLGLDGNENELEIAASESTAGPCDEQLLNLCCTDSRYQDVVDPDIRLPKVFGCAECKFHHSTCFLDSRCFFLDFHISVYSSLSLLDIVGVASITGACGKINAKRFCCILTIVSSPSLNTYLNEKLID